MCIFCQVSLYSPKLVVTLRAVMETKKVFMSELPEEVVDGVKMYGTTSYETQVAILSHYLHNFDGKHDIASGEKRYEILEAIRDYIEFKQKQDKKNPKFTFIDLFAGMGGFRLAMQAQGGKCVFSSEWNAYSQKTYFANFGEMPFVGITKELTKYSKAA